MNTVANSKRVPEGYECKRCGNTDPPDTTCSHCGGSGGDRYSYDGSCYHCGASGAQWPPTCPNCCAFRRAVPDPRTRWVTTRIRDGQVEIMGDVYVPSSDRPLPAGHEDVDVGFAIYWTGDERERQFVALWGELGPSGTADDAPWPGLFCDPIDHRFYWEWWERKEAAA